MTITRFSNLSLAFGEAPLFNEIQGQVELGERIFLVGRNGSGKSSLLKVLGKTFQADSGELWHAPYSRIGFLAQDLPNVLDKTVEEWVTSADPDWEEDARRHKILTALELEPERKISELSGGFKRRAALAQVLIQEPALLILDEPTNHLDVSIIQWLETYLKGYKGALLCVTHDRALVQNLATRIWELDRGHLYSWPGNYENFLEKKEQRLEVEQRHNALFDKRLAQEEVWIRQGVKARRTRNEGRVRALKALREERGDRREVQKGPNFSINESRLSGNKVIEAENISYAFGEKVIVKDFSITIMRGERIAILGGNGLGKSTLINLLLNKMEPQEGSVELGTQLQVAYFDQLRTQIKPNASVIENVAGGRTTITVNGQDMHIVRYLGNFLFTPERAQTPIQYLSGGECNRLLLAKLFSNPANLLVMDEPTNDLDLETLELLENLLDEYPGTLLLISHDRAFVDNIADRCLILKGEGVIEEHIGTYSEYLARKPKNVPLKNTNNHKSQAKVIEKTDTNTAKKLSYNLTRELEVLLLRLHLLK